MEAFDEDFNQTKEYYNELETIVTFFLFPMFRKQNKRSDMPPIRAKVPKMPNRLFVLQ